jgi:hypothetical protein
MAVGQVSIETFGHFEYFILNVNHRNSCIKLFSNRCRRDHDRMVVGFTTTYAMSAYNH